MTSSDSHCTGELQPGTKLAGYIIIAKIGIGGMGTVYRATHLALGKDIALKVLSEEFCRDRKAVKNFFKEAQAVANLRHKNIIQAYDVGTADNGLHYFAMELVEGQNLNEIIDSFDKVPESYAITIAREMADAFKHAWCRNCLSHGDIKPENIMYTHTKEVKITDFGLARSLHDESDEEIMLTPAYAAPELISRATSRISPSTDIYSFGISLYHMLAGAPPFQGDDYEEIYRKHLEEDAVPLTKFGISKRVSDFVDALIQKDPNERIGDWDEVTEYLEFLKEPQISFLKIAVITASIIIVILLTTLAILISKKESISTSGPSSNKEIIESSENTNKPQCNLSLESLTGDPDSFICEQTNNYRDATHNKMAHDGLKSDNSTKIKNNSKHNSTISNKINTHNDKPSQQIKQNTKPTKAAHNTKINSNKTKDIPQNTVKKSTITNSHNKNNSLTITEEDINKLINQIALTNRYYIQLNNTLKQKTVAAQVRAFYKLITKYKNVKGLPDQLKSKIEFISRNMPERDTTRKIIYSNNECIVGKMLKQKPLTGYQIKSVTARNIKLQKNIKNSSHGGKAIIIKNIAMKDLSSSNLAELLTTILTKSSQLSFSNKNTILISLLFSSKEGIFKTVIKKEPEKSKRIWSDLYNDIKQCPQKIMFIRKWNKVVKVYKKGNKLNTIRELNNFQKLINNSNQGYRYKNAILNLKRYVTSKY